MPQTLDPYFVVEEPDLEFVGMIQTRIAPFVHQQHSSQERQLEEAKRMSRIDYSRKPPSAPTAGPSKPSGLQHVGLEHELSDELSRVEESISEKQAELNSLVAQKERIVRMLQEYRKRVAADQEAAWERGQPTINYMDDFDWTSALKTTMKRIFNIDDFRLCQKGLV